MNKDQKREYRKLYIKWLVQGGVSALILGFGLSVFLEGAFLKRDSAPFLEWFIIATVGLALIMSGLAVMIDALRHRIKFLEIKKNATND